MGHVTLWCGTCRAEDHRDSRVLRATAPGRPQPSAQRLGDAAGRLSASDTAARAMVTAEDRSTVLTVTTLTIRSAVRSYDARVPARC